MLYNIFIILRCEKNNTTFSIMTITMSFVVAISLIFATAYAQQDNKPMGMGDKSYKYLQSKYLLKW
jgi:hypothetical protein